MIYEARVAGGLFANGFGGLTIPIVHVSPNKIGHGKVYPEIDGPIVPPPDPPGPSDPPGPPPDPQSVVPEPATCTMLGGGLLAALALRLRRRIKSKPKQTA